MSRIRSGVFWVAVARYGGRVIGAAATLVLAAVLDPADFGLIGGAMIVVNLVTC